MFAQPTSRTNPTAASSVNRRDCEPPTIESRSDASVTVHPVSVAGYSRPRSAAMVVRSTFASASVEPGLSLPIAP